MNRIFRIETLKRMLFGETKKAEAFIDSFKKEAEIYIDVAKSLKEKGFEPEKNKDSEAKKNEPTYSGKIVIPAAKGGVSVTVPDNPIINGKYNVFFQIRHGKNPTKSGVNTIVVEAEAGGMASSENTKSFGNADWVKKQLGIIHSTLSQKFGSNISLGKLGFGSFSGGYDAVKNIISDKELQDKIDSVVILDGIHHSDPKNKRQVDSSAMQPWVDFANKAKNDPTKKFVFVYTAVDPGTYVSTSESANYLMNQTGAQKTDAGGRQFAGVVPASIGSAGGFSAIQLYERKSDKIGFGYTEKEAKKQHIKAAEALADVWREYLYNDWNTVS